MGQTCGIDWTDSSFNPWWGCVEVSPACENCYARSMANMRGFKVWGADAPRRFLGSDHWKEPFRWNKRAQADGHRWRVLCGSMCDVMEAREDLNPYRDAVYWLVEQTPWLDWMFLTKRPQEYRKRLPKSWLQDPRDNVWLLTTVEHQDYVWRINEMMKAPAHTYGIICEPLLSYLDLPQQFLDLGARSWATTSAERGVGKRSRVSDINWFRKLRDDLKANDCNFFFKQWGDWGPVSSDGLVQLPVGHKKSGRLLDGREWNEKPESLWLAAA